jgi:hypothetical protein
LFLFYYKFIREEKWRMKKILTQQAYTVVREERPGQGTRSREWDL